MFVTVILSIACVLLLCYIFSLKSQIRTVTREIGRTSEYSYNRLVTISLFDNDLSALVTALNREIDSRKHMKIRIAKTEDSFKRAISDIAHDLRTPLSVVKGELQLASNGRDCDDDISHYIDVCISKTDELKYMTDSFFELALLESDSEKAKLQRINITNLIMKFIAENEGHIRMHSIEPDIVLPDNTVFAMGDEKLLMRILENLLGNVIKYSSGSFRLELTDGAEIVMSNPAADADNIDTARIFERSYRADGPRRSGSAGLGLNIVKLLCEKIDAKASAEVSDGQLSITVELKECNA
ncbi:MAG: HAMP domain-containing histidine kinase [Ruminococcus sp.]|nr:HAMP domain-containing histidine kinase [Ruminococcus sp.]